MLNGKLSVSWVLSSALALFSIVILVSQWIGFVSLNVVLVWSVSIALFFFLRKRNDFFPSFSFSRGLLAMSALLLFFELYPFLFHWGLFPSSSDAVPTTVTRVLEINQRIVSTHEPFAPLALSYQLGFPLLSKAVHDLFFFLRDFQVIFLLASFFGFVQLISVNELVKSFTGSSNAGLLAGALFVGSKLVFQNLYWGEFAWVAATAFSLLSLLSIQQGKKGHYVFIPTVFALHPAIAINLVLLLAAYFFYFKEKRNAILFSASSVLLAVPSIAFTYVPLAVGVLAGRGVSAGFSFNSLVSFSLVLFPWIGLGALLCLLAGAMVWLFKKKELSPSIPWALFWIASILLYLLFSWTGTILGARVVELVLFSSIAFASFLWKPFLDNPKKSASLAIAVFLVVGLFYSVNSSTLSQARLGSKILPEERDFAQQFHSFDDSVQSTLFLARNGGKMAELSNKIPYDWNSGLFLSFISYHLTPEDEALMRERKQFQQRIVEERCLDCIDSLDVKYVVVDELVFADRLPYPLLLESNRFRLYEKPG